MTRENPPILLTDATAYGTLAAVRCLGRAGIPVTVADPERLVAAAGSRFATRSLRCPPLDDAEAYLEWLEEFARTNPKHVLYPSSDSTAWAYALHRDRLAASFHLRVPHVDAVYALLNKRRLHEAARAVGLDTPVTLFPRDASELERLLPDLRYPVLVKPQTQVLLRGGAKGRCAVDAAETRARWAAFEACRPYARPLVEFDPGAVTPMVQELFDYREIELASVAGFVSEAGELAVLGSTKRLQRPRRIGIGVSFESAPVPAALAGRLGDLCRRVGYHGVFEAELVRANGRELLIDFNPRLYGQMGFEIARGLPSPLLAYLAALGRDAEVSALLARSRTSAPDAPASYVHRFGAAVLLACMAVGGRLRGEDARRWRSLLGADGARAVDAVHDWGDPTPTLLAWGSETWTWLRHPGGFVRTHFRDD